MAYYRIICNEVTDGLKRRSRNGQYQKRKCDSLGGCFGVPVLFTLTFPLQISLLDLRGISHVIPPSTSR